MISPFQTPGEYCSGLDAIERSFSPISSNSSSTGVRSKSSMRSERSARSIPSSFEAFIAETSSFLDGIARPRSPNPSIDSSTSVRSQSSARSKGSVGSTTSIRSNRSARSVSRNIDTFIEEASRATEHEHVTTGLEKKPRLVSSRRSQAYAACVAQIDEWGKALDSVRKMQTDQDGSSQQAHSILVKMYTLRDLIMNHQEAEAEGAGQSWFTAMHMW